MEELREKFSQIYDAHITSIYRFVYLKIGSQETAEDLCSEVFTRLWEELQNGNGGKIENMRAFLYGVARNIVADHYRGRRIRIVSIHELVIDPIGPDSPQDEAAINSDMEQVQKALAQLKDEYQNLVIWRYLDELSVPEIAQITGKTEENVRVGVHRALKQLKEKLAVGVV